MEALKNVIGTGQANRAMTPAEVKTVLAEAFKDAGVKNKRLLFIIPDGTRTAPIPLLFRTIHELIGADVKALDFLVALGTHMPMSEEALNKLVGVTPEERRGKYGKVRILNHEWEKPETFRTVGHISADEISTITSGLLAEAVDVTVNQLIFDYDKLIVCGPVFPHEVAGYSGGNKYFFPGISGPEVINLTHWIGALLTSYSIIGTKHTPIRAVINRAANCIPVEKLCIAFVVKGHDLAGVYFGTPEDAWSAAADLSSQIHVVYVDKPFKQVLSIMPQMYDDIWTASKGMYKMEPVIAPGGEVIIYAPHIDEISYTHGKILDEVGYHVRDYFATQWDKFRGKPWGVLAHSTHLRGIGSYENGVEKARITVTLATRIPEARCRKINLNYRDPATINVADFENREADGVLVVKKAGEMLYRLKQK